MSRPAPRWGASHAAPGLAAIGGLFVLSALAGCGGSSGSTASGTPSTSTTATSPTTASTTTSHGPSPCRAEGLGLRLADAGDGAAATRYLTVDATNTSGSPCTIGGFFEVAAYDLTGKVIEERDAHAPGAPVRQLTVAPGGVVTFTAGINDLPSGAEGQCPRVGSLHLLPPDAKGSQTLSLASAGVVECPGVITVRPVAPA